MRIDSLIAMTRLLSAATRIREALADEMRMRDRSQVAKRYVALYQERFASTQGPTAQSSGAVSGDGVAARNIHKNCVPIAGCVPVRSGCQLDEHIQDAGVPDPIAAIRRCVENHLAERERRVWTARPSEG